MSSVDVKRIDIPTSTPQDQYLPSLFIIEEGEHAFHERLHYWQHVCTTFGAFQILGFHITAKAMRITIRELIAAGLMEVPIRQSTLERLHDRTKGGGIQRVRNYLQLLNRFESAGLAKPVLLKGSKNSFRLFGGWHAQLPLLKVRKTLGIPFTAGHVKEIHAFSIGRLRGEKNDLVGIEKELWGHAEEFLGEETARWMALLCDWALMSPNPNLIEQRSGEIHPGSRFLKGLEALLYRTEPEGRKNLLGVHPLSSWLSKVLGWSTMEIAMEHYDSFIRLAHEGANNQKDASRNRRTYSAIADMLESARDLRLRCPEALAFPHVHESMLNHALPVVATKRGRRLEIVRKAAVYRGGLDWYRTYLANVSLVLQAFGNKEQNEDRIECVYRHLGIEDDCSTLRKAGEGKSCYSFPDFSEGEKIECGFLRLCRELGLN
jgi:hypothetical protein